MANVNETLSYLQAGDGAMCCAVVDYQSGMVLGTSGTGLDLDLAAAGNTEVVRAKMKTAKMLGITGGIEDILITLAAQYHLIRPCTKYEGLFIYYVLDKARANLALSRRRVLEAEQNMTV